MQHSNRIRTALLMSIAALATSAVVAAEPAIRLGERLGAESFGPTIVEGIDAVLARDAERLATTDASSATKRGEWIVPPLGATFQAASGQRYVINRWGDLRMAIGFRGVVDLRGVHVVGQSGAALWPRGLRAFGYRDGELVAVSDPLEAIGAVPVYWNLGLVGVDRVVLEALPSAQGGGWYGLDDLTLEVPGEDGVREQIVLDFEDLAPRTLLAEVKYRDLDWEAGAGAFDEPDAVPPPRLPDGVQRPAAEAAEAAPVPLGTATPPTVKSDFRGVIRGDGNAFSFPPDTHGAIGPDHFVVAVNRVFAVYDRDTGDNLVTTNLGSFLPGSSGDPRVLFDQYSQRWIMLVSNFSDRIFIAVSSTSDPLGSWFKSSILVSTDGDQGCFPDYQTIGVSEQGIYSGTFMAGFCGMAVLAIEKAPLLRADPSLGAVTIFRDLPFEGAIQPAHHFGDSNVAYLLSVANNTSLRVRTVQGPITNPTLVNSGFVSVPGIGSPPDAPALGSTINLDTVGNRLMMAVYRGGRLWTAHTVSQNGRAAVRWYEIGTSSLTVLQSGTVADSLRHYFFPSIMVNSVGDAVMGFSGSSANEYASCYVVGRTHTNPAGVMSEPILVRGGLASQNNFDGFGRNRWGDYSFTSLDPRDEAAIWTIQEYAHATNIWGTWIAQLDFGDCNGNAIEDAIDIASGFSSDCDGNGRPDECQLIQNDCNGDSTPDNCNEALLIALHPQDTVLCPTETAVFSAASTQPDLPLQWLRDGQPVTDDGRITGSTTATLSIADVSQADAGLYTLSVIDGCLVAQTDSAELLVREPPGFVSEPPAVRKVCDGNDLILAVSAVGTAPLTYQWQKDGVDIVGQQDDSLFISNAEPADEGVYQCVVTNACDATISNGSELMVLQPEITEQPADQCAEPGGSAGFSVAATGPEPLIYSWRKDGATIPGANDPTLSLNDVQEDDLGAYTVLAILAESFCITESAPATLTFGTSADGAELVNCFSGAGIAASPACRCTFDDDEDGDIDLVDFAAWQRVAPTLR